VSGLAFLFIVLWSTGFIAGKWALPFAPPLTLIAIRLALASLVAAGFILALKIRMPRNPRSYLHIIVSGILLHACFQGGIFYAIYHGLPAGLCALIIGLQPILTALIVFFGREKLTPRQWMGMVLGLIGTVAVLSRGGLLTAGGVPALGLIVPALVGLVGLTVGTLYQKRFCSTESILPSTFVQYVACFVVTGALGLVVERPQVRWTGTLVLSLGWLSIVLSIGAVALLFMLIRKQSATLVAAYFYLVPVFTMMFGFILFHEHVGVAALFGCVVSVIGIYLVSHSAAPEPKVVEAPIAVVASVTEE
jgi:drug/metabolite transporter (DMT)-like permease